MLIQNRTAENLTLKFSQKFLGFQVATFGVFGLARNGGVSRRGKLVVACDHLFLQKDPLVAEGVWWWHAVVALWKLCFRRLKKDGENYRVFYGKKCW